MISTHTSRVGCDGDVMDWSKGFSAFLLTHPVWDVTTVIYQPLAAEEISTHTSRVGCDFVAPEEVPDILAISTHTSRVGCDIKFKWKIKGVDYFLSLIHI